MSSINKVILVGSLGKNPEIKDTKAGKSIALLSVATGTSYKDKQGNKVENTEWHRVVIFNEGLAKVASDYLKKGSKVYVEGELRTRKWNDNGVDKYTTEIVLQGFNSNLTMLDTKGIGSNNKSNQQSNNSSGGIPPEIEDEIPFS